MSARGAGAAAEAGELGPPSSSASAVGPPPPGGGAQLTLGSIAGRSGVGGRIDARRRRNRLVDWRMPGDLPRSLIQMAESAEYGEQAGPLATPETAALTTAAP